MAVTVTNNTKSSLFHTSGEYAYARAFAAIKKDGSVIPWGNNSYYSYLDTIDLSAVATELNGAIDVVQIFSTRAALRTDGSVVTWGNIFGIVNLRNR